LGKKLSSRAKKELEDVSQRTLVPILGCRRIFDNMRRIMKYLEDVEGDILDTIQREFLLPRDLARYLL
jgi:hypothetical protein